MSDGFLFNQLSEFKQELFRSIQADFPEETNKFLSENAQNFKKQVQKTANREVKKGEAKVNYKGKSVNYHKKFKVGKKYKRDESLCIRVYNGARHAHLIEQGHVMTDHKGKPLKFVSGKYVFKQAEIEFLPEFEDNVEKFMFEYFDKTTEI